MKLVNDIWVGQYSITKIFLISCGIIFVYLIILTGMMFINFYVYSDYILKLSFLFLYFFPLIVIIIAIKGIFTSAKSSGNKIAAVFAILTLMLFTAIVTFTMEFFYGEIAKDFQRVAKSEKPYLRNAQRCQEYSDAGQWDQALTECRLVDRI